jgi:lipopolysaccharide/colanic/teichoic acid biosynthesis glycosyltransferase
VRRLIDVLFALFCLLVSWPLLAVIALLIKRESPGPIFYIPKMVGQHRRLFPLFRFRTMYVNPSDQIIEQRFTHTGHFIRAYSLDHLPTLINLLIGDITLVGPRPMELAVVDVGDPVWRAYFKVKPGLCNYAVLKLGKLWTPSRTTDPHRNQAMELAYRQRQSWWSDMGLFLQSVYALISSKGNVKARKEPDRDLEDE